MEYEKYYQITAMYVQKNLLWLYNVHNIYNYNWRIDIEKWGQLKSREKKGVKNRAFFLPTKLLPSTRHNYY